MGNLDMVIDIIDNKDLPHFRQTAWRKKLHLRLDEDVHKKVKTLCAQRGISIQQFISDLIKKAV